MDYITWTSVNKLTFSEVPLWTTQKAVYLFRTKELQGIQGIAGNFNDAFKSLISQN